LNSTCYNDIQYIRLYQKLFDVKVDIVWIDIYIQMSEFYVESE